MDSTMPEHNSSSSHKRLSVSYLVSLMVLCARHANRLSKKLKHKKPTHSLERFQWKLTRSPVRTSPKELFKALRNEAMKMFGRTGYSGGFKKEKKEAVEMEEHGVWQREILMGGKCEPLDFSGVIYYDSNGRQLKEVPSRSPRGSPLPNYPSRS